MWVQCFCFVFFKKVFFYLQIPTVHNMSKEIFLRNYAYTSRPVLIKNGTGNWTALRIFGFRYFKTLYTKLNAFDDFRELGCLFFPYKTSLESLEHLFTLSLKEAKKFQAQWYVGWWAIFIAFTIVQVSFLWLLVI